MLCGMPKTIFHPWVGHILFLNNTNMKVFQLNLGITQKILLAGWRLLYFHLQIHVMSYHVMSHQIRPFHAIPWHIMSHHIMSHHMASCYAMLHHMMTCHITSCNIMTCHVMLGHDMQCHAMSPWIDIPCHVMSHHAILCHIMSCHVMSHTLQPHCLSLTMSLQSELSLVKIQNFYPPSPPQY